MELFFTHPFIFYNVISIVSIFIDQPGCDQRSALEGLLCHL